MALKFNTHDKIYYGSQTDIDNDTEIVLEPTAKAYAYGDITSENNQLLVSADKQQITFYENALSGECLIKANELID
jgi:hypothetical protein